MNKLVLALMFVSTALGNLAAQVCDPSVAPTGLTSTYTPGTGALLEWEAVPGSVGVQVKITSLSDGIVFTQRNIVFERDWLLIPEDRFSPGNYTWQVQAACSTFPPYSVTPISASNSFTVDDGSFCPATLTDIDGNVYTTVAIGSQCWMAENLKVERYSNGDTIQTGLSSIAWSSVTSGAYAVYNNVEANKAIYGLLYNWYAAVDPRDLCPLGWHVPTDLEWKQLTDFLSGSGFAGGKMKTTGTLGAGTGLWQAPNTSATNSSGFSGLPGGIRYRNGIFDSAGLWGRWWGSSEISTDLAWNRGLQWVSGAVFRGDAYKGDGVSIRCLWD